MNKKLILNAATLAAILISSLSVGVWNPFGQFTAARYQCSIYPAIVVGNESEFYIINLTIQINNPASIPINDVTIQFDGVPEELFASTTTAPFQIGPKASILTLVGLRTAFHPISTTLNRTIAIEMLFRQSNTLYFQTKFNITLTPYTC